MASSNHRQRDSSAEVRDGCVENISHLRVFARALTRDHVAAEDLVQDTMVKALANIHRFEPGSRLRPWLFTIMRNTFYSDLRKRRREVQDVDGELAGRLVQLPDQDGALDFVAFKRAFAQLQDDHREVLTLVGISGCSYEEAAAICGCAIGTIKSRVNRARQRLEAIMSSDAPVSNPALQAERDAAVSG